MKKIILIDDNQQYLDIFEELLKLRDYEVEATSDVFNAIEKLKMNNYDLAIIDYYLPNLTGAQVVEVLRNYKIAIKTIILTSSNDYYNELRSLECGADEFIKKDTAFEVIFKRIEKVLRTGEDHLKTDYLIYSRAEKLEIDPYNRVAKREGEIIHLTITELDLLTYLIKNKNTVLTRDELIEGVWGISATTPELDLRVVDVHIKNIRCKLKINAINTVRGIGYRWNE